MNSKFTDLHDYKLRSWSIDRADWVMVLDIENPNHSVRQEFKGTVEWYADAVRRSFVVLIMTAWDIHDRLLTDPRALRSWRRVFGFVCSDGEILGNSASLIERHKTRVLVSIETADGGTIDLICDELLQTFPFPELGDSA